MSETQYGVEVSRFVRRKRRHGAKSSAMGAFVDKVLDSPGQPLDFYEVLASRTTTQVGCGSYSACLFQCFTLTFVLHDTPTPPQIAKSGRAHCKKCKGSLEKDQLRIVSIAPPKDEGGYEIKSYTHPVCFTIPRKYATGANKISVEEFVTDHLQDFSDDGASLLPARAAEVIAAISTKADTKKKDSSAGGGGNGPLALVQQAYQARQEQQTSGVVASSPPPPAKKTKGADGAAAAATAKEPNGALSAAVDAYEQYHKLKNDQLKELLKWNRQHVTGTKDVLLHRVVDGAVYGRLPRCPLDGGRLKLLETAECVQCGGTFDESTMTRLDCTYKQPADQAVRAEWYVWCLVLFCYCYLLL